MCNTIYDCWLQMAAYLFLYASMCVRVLCVCGWLCANAHVVVMYESGFV